MIKHLKTLSAKLIKKFKDNKNNKIENATTVFLYNIINLLIFNLYSSIKYFEHFKNINKCI